MKRVSIQDLKANLSANVVAAESGMTIIVTRHNEAVATLGPARAPHVHYGSKSGTGRLAPAIKRGGTPIRYLEALLEDRANR